MATAVAGDVSGIIARLESANSARETALGECRQVIRCSGRSIRAVHRLDGEAAASHRAEAETHLRRAQQALDPHPALVHAGFLHDAEKEFAEAVATAAFIVGDAPPGPGELQVGDPAWLHGLAEAASELRRHLLDRLRGGQLEEAERLLNTMDDIYDVLVDVDFPDALTAGLRRATDALRAVLERSRADVTTTVLQVRLQRVLESR